jgi:hypothetical protein
MRLAYGTAVGVVVAVLEWGVLITFGKQATSEILVYCCMTVLLVLIGDLGSSFAENRSGLFMLALLMPIICHAVVIFIVTQQSLLASGAMSADATNRRVEASGRSLGEGNMFAKYREILRQSAELDHISDIRTSITDQVVIQIRTSGLLEEAVLKVVEVERREGRLGSSARRGLTRSS